MAGLPSMMVPSIMKAVESQLAQSIVHQPRPADGECVVVVRVQLVKSVSFQSATPKDVLAGGGWICFDGSIRMGS